MQKVEVERIKLMDAIEDLKGTQEGRSGASLNLGQQLDRP